MFFINLDNWVMYGVNRVCIDLRLSKQAVGSQIGLLLNILTLIEIFFLCLYSSDGCFLYLSVLQSAAAD